MKKKPQQCTRQGKSNTNIKSFLSNLKENDLHLEDSQITQCVFLGVLRLKPVPSIFSSNNVPSVTVENKSKRFKNNNNTKEINKNVPRKKDINKVISGRVGKKNPEKIKASIKKLPTKKPVIKLNFNMNRKKKDSNTNVPETVRILPESLTKITPESVFTNQTITLNPITTVSTFNPVQNLFDKLKQQLDGRRSTEVSKESLFFNELLDVGNIQSSKKQKKSNKKSKSDRLTMRTLPSSSSFSDNGYHSSNSSINTKSTEDVMLFNDNNVEDEEDCEVLLNSGPMPSFVLQSNNEVILIPDDTSNRSSPNRDLIVIEDTRNVRMSPRFNKNEQNEVINLEEKSPKMMKEKPIKRRRTLMPSAIPSIFFNTPRLLRSELGQKKGSLENKSLKSMKPLKVENKQEKPSTKPKKDIKTKGTENLIYEVVKFTEPNKPTENESNSSQDQVLVVEHSPPKVEPLIIKLKKSTEKNITDQNGNEDNWSKEKTQKAAKNLFFPRLLRSDINIKKSNKAIETVTSEKDSSTGKISVKSTKDLFEDFSLLDDNVENKSVGEKPSKNEKSPLSVRRTLRSDVCPDESSSNIINIEDIQEIIEIIDHSTPEKKTKDEQRVHRQKNIVETLEKQLTSESAVDEIIDVDLYDEKSKNVNNNNNDTEKVISRNVQSDTTEIIDINEAETIENSSSVESETVQSESDLIDVDKSEDASTKNTSKFKSIAVVQPMSRQPRTPQKNVPNETVNSPEVTPDESKKNKKTGDVEAQIYTVEDKSNVSVSSERRQLRSDDNLKVPNENLDQTNSTPKKSKAKEVTDLTIKKSKADGAKTNEVSVSDTGSTLKKSKTDGVKATEVSVSDTGSTLKKSKTDGVKATEVSVSDTGSTLKKSKTDGVKATEVSVSDTGSTLKKSKTDGVKANEVSVSDTGSTLKKSKTDGVKATEVSVSDTGSTLKKSKTDGVKATEVSLSDTGSTLKKSKTDGVKATEVSVSDTGSTLKKSKTDGVKATDVSVSDTGSTLKKSKTDGVKAKEVSVPDIEADKNTAKPRTLRSNIAQDEEVEEQNIKISDMEKSKIDTVEENKLRMLRSSNIKENSDEKIHKEVQDNDTNGDNEESGNVIEKSERVEGPEKIKKKNKKVIVNKSVKKPFKLKKISGKTGTGMKNSKEILLKSRKMLKKKKKSDFSHKITADYQIMNQADLIVNTTRNHSKINTLEVSSDILDHPGMNTNAQRSKSKEKPKKVDQANSVDDKETAKATTTKETIEKVPKNKKLIKQKKLTTKLVKNMKKVGRPKKSVGIIDVPNKKTADVVIMKQAETLIVHTKRGTSKSNECVGVETENVNDRSIQVKKELKVKKKLGRKKIPLKTKKKSRRRQEDLNVITIVSEKRTKKQGNISPKVLRSSLNPIVKEDIVAVPIVEKVVALIHSEPKPKDFYKNVDEAEGDKNQSRTLRSQNFSDTETIEIVPGKQRKGKQNKDLPKKKEKVIAKSKLSKIPNKKKQKLIKQFKKKIRNNKTTTKSTKKPRKSNIDWQNNDIIERIIQEIKNTIFKQGSKENNRRRTTVVKTNKTVKQKTKMLKKKKKKVIQAAKKKMQQTKEALKRKLRSTRTVTSVEIDGKKEEVKTNKSSVIIINEVTVPKPVNIVEKTVYKDPELSTTKKDITVFDFDESEPEMVPLRPHKPNESPDDVVNTEKNDSEPQNQPEPPKKLLYSRIPVDEGSTQKKRLDSEKQKLHSRATDSSEYDKRIFFENPPTSQVRKKRLYSEILVYSDEEEAGTSKRIPEVVENTKQKEVSVESAGKRKLIIPYLDDDGKPRKLWSIIDTPTTRPVTPPVSPKKHVTPEITTQSTSEKSPKPSDNKSPMKQPTIIEMFSKVWMKKENPAVKTLSEEQEVFSRPLPRGATVPVPVAPSPARERPEDDDSDTESRVEWIPEEYAEYKYKYSSNKMMQYKPIFKCKICMMVLPSYYKLLKHRKEHENQDKPYNCPQCGTDFSNVEDFSAHLRIHKGKHPYMCSKCDAGFWTKSAYEAHIPVHILKKAKQPVKKFRCDICAKEFSKLCDVERHTRVHTGEKPCICNICNKRFQQAHNLSKHLITHLHIKPFHCEICNKQFGRNDVLRRHLLTHSVDKPVKCSVCLRGFIRHSQLLQHMRRKHPETPIDDLREQFGDEEDLSDSREEFDEQPSSSSENKGSIKTEA